MNLKELKVPIRIYWDLSPRPPAGEPDYEAICRDIIDLKILSLNLVDTAPVVGEACLRILDRLKDTNLAVTLASSSSACSPASLELLKSRKVRALFIKASSINELGVQEVYSCKETNLPLGIYFETARTNWQDLPAVLLFCLDNNIKFLVLPMQRLTVEEAFFLNQAEKEQLAASLNKLEIPASLKLIIHDPFLWKVFYPLVPFPEGGCQAANTMLYISPEGDVYPCPSMPFKIGNLTDESLKALVYSDRKNEMRGRIIQYPEGCANCGELVGCKGGCRGRTFSVTGSLNNPDPGCL